MSDRNQSTLTPDKVLTGRLLSACKRCKVRKIKCSYDNPSCQACAKSESICEYPNADRGADTRSATAAAPVYREYGSQGSAIRRLENRVAFLEAALTARDNQTSPNHTAPTESPIADGSAFNFRSGPPSSWQAIGRLPPAPELAGLELNPLNDITDTSDHANVPASSLPALDLLKSATDHFFLEVNAMYAILEETKIQRALMDFESHGVTPEMSLTLYIILAIYHLRPSRPSDLARPPGASYQDARASYSKALSQLSIIWRGPALRRLQVVLLMLQYVLRDPDMGDVWDLCGRASRIAIELGLHLEPSTLMKSDEQQLRRTLFWTTFNSDCLISVALGRPQAIQLDWISTELPHLPPALTPQTQQYRTIGLHHCHFRLLQAEIHQRLYAVSATKKPRPDQGWFLDIQARLDSWQNDYAPTEAEYMNPDRHRLHYHLLQTLLYRPSPGNQTPQLSELCKAVNSAAQIIRIYKTLLRRNELHFYWLGVHHVFMAGVTYLNSLWIANRHSWRIVSSYVEAILDIQTCASVLEGLTAREPGTHKMRDAFEVVSAGVVRNLSSQNVAAEIRPAPNDNQPFFDDLQQQHSDVWSLNIGSGNVLFANSIHTEQATDTETLERFLFNPFVDLDNGLWTASLQNLGNAT